MINEAIGRALCAALRLDADAEIQFPAEPLEPNAPPRFGPRWRLAAELAERQRLVAEALAG